MYFNPRSRIGSDLTGSNVLMEQIGKYKDEIPFLTKIEKVNKFYTFT